MKKHLLSAARELQGVIRRVLDGSLSGEDAANEVFLEFADLEDSLRTDLDGDEKLFVRSFWAVEQLREHPEYRPRREELKYLLRCLEGAEQYDESKANAFYEP